MLGLPWRADFGCGRLAPRSRVLRSERQATSPLLWVATQLGHFLSDGYREIRALIASNTPRSFKKPFTSSLAALVLALLAVIVIASSILRRSRGFRNAGDQAVQ